ncbi:gliding motility-associated lipoprotein GldD [Mucilaginibacter paludis DSM 18603]|uniref:Gliding motility-associated lipoprotein GldD n=1 Tax=Mucilaginibacter paludis DSM 18603 TaxID=714943 RepID=H1Y4P0_9SPHI|nr:gliding motility lipoprotein GldD [Mucilaginibacter paludis]EHQ28084.1 gliding motility-associated lipoprotein GldD [Mucilaginibacter paludis DSM 18603]
MELKNQTSMRLAGFLMIIAMLFSACGGNRDYSPKPRGYFRIEFPDKVYQQYDGGCPFTFQYPKYAVVEIDSMRGSKPCWLNVQFPQFKGTLHLSYEDITSKKVFNELVEDAHLFAFKHTIKATSIDEGAIAHPATKVYGIYYTIDGNAASSAQFFLTDSTRHYLRGALYFNTEPRLDSIQPVLTFIKKDMDVMIQGLRWKN